MGTGGQLLKSGVSPRLDFNKYQAHLKKLTYRNGI
jgi:hypothetical protein